jgi:alpha-tubulin suppressor-like RCC1 family protein
VIKISCGDTHSALLTANAQVYTWGYNKFGVLGIDSDKTVLQLNPGKPLKFKDGKSIVDITCGLNTMLALTDESEVFAWGRRMGVYPTVELTFDQM